MTPSSRLPKLGIDASEFTLPNGNGRVRFYRDNGWDFGDPNIPAETQLYDSLAEMKKYDMIIIDCVGGEVQKTAAQRKNLEDYTAAGGRVFSSHFGYVWLYDQPIANSFTPTATWNPRQNDPQPGRLHRHLVHQGPELRHLGAERGRGRGHLHGAGAAHSHSHGAPRLRRGHRAGAALGLRLVGHHHLHVAQVHRHRGRRLR